MNKNALSLFPARVAIGMLQPDGSVLPSPEFVRAMSALFGRVGGSIGMGSDDLALLASAVAPPDPQARRAAADALTAPAIDQSALIAALIGKIATLQAQVTQIESVRAELAKLSRRIDGVEQVATHRDPFRVNWERPGAIGSRTANTGKFTTVQSTGGAGFNGAAPQTAYASGGALAAYGAGANGLDTAANMAALHAMVVKIRAALVANGTMS
jgi:hypothetical protein